MDENNSKSNSKKKRASTSSINYNNNNSQSNLVFLINKLSSQIRKFYLSTKQCLSQGKQTTPKKYATFDLINRNLDQFLLKAKDIFKRMKYMHKINLIQQEMNNAQNQNNNFDFNKYNDNIYLKSNFENKIKNKKFLNEEEVNVPSLFNDKNNSFNINNYFHKINAEKNNLHDKNKRKDIKSLSNSSKDLKLINKYNCTFNNDANNKNHHSTNKIMYNNYNRQYNNLKRNINIKSVINLRKKIIFDKKSENSSLAFSSSQGLSNLNSNNNSKNNIFQPKKEIFDNLQVIITLLKELKAIKGDIFTKTIEAQRHKKVMNKIYNELLVLIKNIFKENNINVTNSMDIFDRFDKTKSNNSYNLTYNYKIFNNNGNNNNKNINYKKEIKYRDLIIQQLKDELNIKSQKNSKNKININNNNSYQEENKNKTKKLINEIQQKIDKNQKKNLNNLNMEKHLDILKHKCFELQKEKENILSLNDELNNKIILLNQELEIMKKNISINPTFQELIVQNFYFDYSSSDIINEKTKKIIDDLNNEINNHKEENKKAKEEIVQLNEEINKYKENINKLNEENNQYKEKISKLNQKYNENITEIRNMKENIENTNTNIEKYKKIISLQEEEIKNLKANSQIQNKSDKEFLNKSLPLPIPLKESFNNQIIITEEKEKKSKKRNNSKINEYQMEQDKIYLKYELLKNDYDKLNTTLIQKQKLLDNYSKISSETASKTNIDEQILELMAEHKKEIETLTEKYNKNIMSLKMNMPSPYSPATHSILMDKRYSKYDLKWYLITVLTENEKNYENTFWVSELEMKPILEHFNKYKTEKELEDEKFDNLYKLQEKWIKQLDEKEKIIEEMRNKLDFYENTHQSN